MRYAEITHRTFLIIETRDESTSYSPQIQVARGEKGLFAALVEHVKAHHYVNCPTDLNPATLRPEINRLENKLANHMRWVKCGGEAAMVLMESGHFDKNSPEVEALQTLNTAEVNDIRAQLSELRRDVEKWKNIQRILKPGASLNTIIPDGSMTYGEYLFNFALERSESHGAREGCYISKTDVITGD